MNTTMEETEASNSAAVLNETSSIRCERVRDATGASRWDAVTPLKCDGGYGSVDERSDSVVERKNGEVERKDSMDERKYSLAEKGNSVRERKNSMAEKRDTVAERRDSVGERRYSIGERRRSSWVSWGSVAWNGNQDGSEIEAPDGGWGWLVTASAFTLMFVSAIPCVSFGILFSSFLLEQRTSATTTAWIFNLALINSGFFSYFVGPLVDELGWRRVGFVSSMAFGVGMIMCAFATSPGFLFLSFSVIVGCNIEILMNISYMVVPHYFTRWRNVANSIMTSGICASQMIMAPAITYLQEVYGFKGATLITGAIFLHGCAASVALHPVEWHSRVTKKNSNAANLEASPMEERSIVGKKATASNLEEECSMVGKNKKSGVNLEVGLTKECSMVAKKSGAPNLEALPTEECSVVGKSSKLHADSDASKSIAAGKTSGNGRASEVNGTSEARRTLVDGGGTSIDGGGTLVDEGSLESGGGGVSETKRTSKAIRSTGAIACMSRIFWTAIHNLRYLKSPVIVLIATVLGMLYTVMYNVFTIVPFAMESNGFTQRESSFCLSISGICNIVSRLLTSFLSFCPGIKVRPLYLFGSFLAAISATAFSLAQTLTGKALSMGVCGFGYGFAASLYNLYIVEELGLTMLIPTLGIASFLTGILYLILGPLTGVVQDMSKSYVVTFSFCSSCLLLSVFLGFLTPAAHALEQRRKQRSAAKQNGGQYVRFKQGSGGDKQDKS